MSLVVCARVMFYAVDHRQVGCEIVSYPDLIFLALLHCMDIYMYAMLTFIFLVGAICFVISISWCVVRHRYRVGY